MKMTNLKRSEPIVVGGVSLIRKEEGHTIKLTEIRFKNKGKVVPVILKKNVKGKEHTEGLI
jgi:hypothetical protein